MSDDSPSWVVPPAATATAEAAAGDPIPTRLRAVVAVTLALVALELVHVAGRDDLVVAFRFGLGVVVAVQVALAVLAARRSAAAALGLFVYQATTVLAALAGGFGELRAVLAAGAVVAGMLLASSLHRFPSPALPPITSNPPDGP